MPDSKKAILMNKKDNVAMALFPIEKNNSISVFYNNEKAAELCALEDIELYHKIAIKPIQKGDLVFKYGEIIGKATDNIKVGQHVHINNIESVMTKNEN
ncbi:MULTISPECIES: UxaA family hydrolase [Tissierellales]|jgi:altronate dehydratase small subunit|uniref:Hydrolase n=1 Tax=Acidilutibacter cellobiosedens TaxID=2507161 RepID=A0A410Q8X9_9FIRM|nr:MULTISPECIES: UxaA family hydrolase [Tissierellales]QAT60421.1 hydrolase [Acidilutibacter cellobiosedens]SCL88467.1 Altronate dehydratase [Sporanaerobacter sp. PP17-6a]